MAIAPQKAREQAKTNAVGTAHMPSIKSRARKQSNAERKRKQRTSKHVTMTKEEFNRNKRAIEIKCEVEMKELIKEFATQNNPIKVGDIVTDHYHTIKVEHISYRSWQYGGKYPECVYKGVLLKKDGTPYKSMKYSDAYQSNVLFINQQPYKYTLE